MRSVGDALTSLLLAGMYDWPELEAGPRDGFLTAGELGVEQGRAPLFLICFSAAARSSSFFSGLRHQFAPFPGSLFPRGNLWNAEFKERLWRIEFCRPSVDELVREKCLTHLPIGFEMAIIREICRNPCIDTFQRQILFGCRQNGLRDHGSVA